MTAWTKAVVVVGAWFGLAACGGLQVGPVQIDPGGAVAVTPGEAGTGPAYGPGDDAQWMQADDWFFATEVPESGWFRTRIGKLKVAASPATKGQAQFFDVRDATEAWATWHFRTRPAVAGDFALGNLMICYEGNNDGVAYLAPPNKTDARTGQWFAAKVTDTSDAFKGLYRIDTYVVRVAACRVRVN